MVNRLFSALAWSYSGAVLCWAALYYLFGDSVWFLALVNPFAPLWGLVLLLLLLLWLATPTRKTLLVLLLPGFIFARLYLPFFIPPSVPQIAPNSSSFTILSHNIWKGSVDPASAQTPVMNLQRLGEPEGIGHFLSASVARNVYAMPDQDRGSDQAIADGPDIIALQELTSDMAAYYIDELGDQYPSHLFNLGGDIPRRLGIFSHFPIEPIDVEYLNRDDFRVQLARITTPERSFLLYNVHPRATDIVRFWQEDEPFGKRVGQSFFERERYFRLLLTDISLRSEPVVVVGDLNSTTFSDVYTLMTQTLIDSHQEAGWGMGYTFPMHAGDFGGFPIPRRFMRLDMILYSPELVALRSEVGSFRGESDHLPVIAQLGWLNE